MNSQYDFLVKILIIGDSGVGKTCFLLQFADGLFEDSHITTIGIDFKIKMMEVDGKIAKLQIWDTAGQERFRTITKTYYKNAQGIILAYDITDADSFANIRNWIEQIKQHVENNVSIMLIGNKCDDPRRVISTQQGQDLASEFNVPFYETSAKENKNVYQTFHMLARSITSDMQLKIQSNQRISLDSTNTSKKSSGCCK